MNKIKKINGKKHPCKVCRKKLRIDCKEDLKLGMRIVYDPSTKGCIVTDFVF